MNAPRRGAYVGPANLLPLMRLDDDEFREERIAIMTADGIPEGEARRVAEERTVATRALRRRLLVASVERAR